MTRNVNKKKLFPIKNSNDYNLLEYILTVSESDLPAANKVS